MHVFSYIIPDSVVNIVSVLSCKFLYLQYSFIVTNIMLCFRHRLNRRKNKADECTNRKPNIYSDQLVLACLSNINNEVKDDSCTRPLSKSLVGGSTNVCKIRVLTFVQAERVVPGWLLLLLSDNGL